MKISPKKYDNNKVDLHNNWPAYVSDLQQYKQLCQFTVLVIPNILDNNNISTFRSELKNFNKFVQHQYTIEFAKYNNEQIKKFIQQRYDNYNGNQSQMLDFFLARDKRVIVLDRVLHTANDG